MDLRTHPVRQWASPALSRLAPLGRLRSGERPGVGSARDLARRKVVVVGGGMAAQRFVERLAASPSSDRFALTVLTDEPHPPYDRIHLGEVIAGKAPASLVFRDESWYTERGIALHTRERVLEIDRHRRVVFGRTGTEYEYDHLVLATGGSPVLPPIEGVELEGVETYRTLEDVERIARHARAGARVVIAGGGLLGLELAHGLLARGCEVEVVEMAPRLLPRQLDVVGARVLEAQLRRSGIVLRLNARIREIVRGETGLELRLHDGETIAGDLVVVATGIRPVDQLAREAGMACHPKGGILVDDRLATSDPSIDAIGECTRHRDELQGFVAPCYEMAEVLAQRFSGHEAIFEGCTSAARLKIESMDVGAVGESLADGIGIQSLEWSTDAAYRRVVLREGRVVGAIAVGDTDDLPSLQESISRRARIGTRQRRRFDRTGRLNAPGRRRPVAQWSDKAVVCTCTGVTCGGLRSAMAQGVLDSPSLCQRTGAGSVCGTCRPLVAELAGEVPGAGSMDSRTGLVALGLAGIAALAAIPYWAPLPMSQSLVDDRTIDFLWRDAWWKQVSGFALVGVTLASLLLSVRKRWPKLHFGEFAHWRLLHSALGVSTIIGVGLHTGFRMGANLNFVLMSCFAAVLVLGSTTAIVTSAERRLPAPWGGALRRGWTWAHVVAAWPLPVLTAFHVLAVYLY